MDFSALEGLVSGALTLVVYSALIAAIIKIFQISSALSDIKDLLNDIRRNTQDYSIGKSPVSAQSPEELARALNAAAYRAADAITIQPE